MPRQKFQTLTEQMFYILLCLREPCRGIDLFDRIQAQSSGRVTVGSGTLYNLLEQFLTEGMIEDLSPSGRRKHYRLTAKGLAMLEEEYRRLLVQARDFEAVFGKEAAP
ncbi:MAG TPA: helix-turn-helix transcriptional regulator [Candidatus Avoscillospira avicola]|uniref:Helix-turn-helix transcriptional regulator n=1 Tax=Candidatus Avoscillospira avicola TaxID=2840706 RepID=A0A9D1IWD1_9FIRM|nr:helix-turn-helix transcriptional regulator [Candidatus Avoscillospira avicola]